MVENEDLDKIERILSKLVENRKPERQGVVERHAQTIMVGLVTLGIVFVGGSITNQSADIKVLQVQGAHMKQTITEIRDFLSADVFVTQQEFRAHNSEINRRFLRFENHVKMEELNRRNSPSH